jgi:hypothetical protein
MKIIISKKVLEIDKDYDKKLKQSLDFNLEWKNKKEYHLKMIEWHKNQIKLFSESKLFSYDKWIKHQSEIRKHETILIYKYGGKYNQYTQKIDFPKK